jgi:GNAT superfamily N-acetyltransferase
MNILQLRHRLFAAPSLEVPSAFTLRTFADPADVAVWLDLRHRAFARARVGVRQWDEADFEREFLSKPWWRPEHLWFAEADGAPVGTVTLALRGEGDAAVPVVHWLAVLPAWRRRGVGRMLMSVLEARAWELGYRDVWLETHAAWVDAVRLYRAMGYQAVSG